MSTDREAIARETANKLAKLFIARRDVKAIQRTAAEGGEWMAVKTPLELSDFQTHLFEKRRCLGTYLLDKKSKVKFVAFDLDMSDNDQNTYFRVDDVDLATVNEKYEAMGEVDLDLCTGSWSAALHDESSDGYRWVRSWLRVMVETLCDRVEDQLGLPAVPVITGGGAHVLVPFGDKIDASEGRAAAHGVMEGWGVFQRVSENFYTNAPDIDNRDDRKRIIGETVSVEVFPKQDRLPDGDHYGNLIRLPFGWHDEAKMRTYVMKREPGLLPPWDLPKANGIESLDAVMSRLGLTADARD